TLTGRFLLVSAGDGPTISLLSPEKSVAELKKAKSVLIAPSSSEVNSCAAPVFRSDTIFSIPVLLNSIENLGGLDRRAAMSLSNTLSFFVPLEIVIRRPAGTGCCDFGGP